MIFAQSGTITERMELKVKSQMANSFSGKRIYYQIEESRRQTVAQQI